MHRVAGLALLLMAACGDDDAFRFSSDSGKPDAGELARPDSGEPRDASTHPDSGKPVDSGTQITVEPRTAGLTPATTVMSSGRYRLVSALSTGAEGSKPSTSERYQLQTSSVPEARIQKQ